MFVVARADMLFDGKDWWAEGRATNGKKAKEDVQQGGVVGLEGGSWVAEKNGGNLLGCVVLEEFCRIRLH